MKELDFDELDRAVSSLMTTANKDASTSPSSAADSYDDNVKTITLPTTLPVSESSNTNTTSTSLPMQRPTASVATRRSGRFMDVVHTSSDMKKPDLTSKKPNLPSREGAAITPPVTPTDALKVDAAEKTEAAPESQGVVVNESLAGTSDWPDPLDIHEAKKATVIAGKEGEFLAESPLVASEPAPLTSPFLPGAKVEKRPLGGSAPLESILDESSDKGEDLTVDDPNDQLPITPSAPSSIPEELQGDLVAIESGSASEKEESSHANESKAAPAEKQPSTAPAGPVSIPQQYKEEPSTSSQESGAIYDTDSYHKPLAHPQKKKSGWLWVLWIVLILGLGAATGAALYMFKVI